MTDTLNSSPASAETAEVPQEQAASRAKRRAATSGTRTITSPNDLRSVRGRSVYWLSFAVLFGLLTLSAIGPLFWMLSGSLKTTQELVNPSPSLLPRHLQFGNFSYAWSDLGIPRYLLNTVVLAGGALVAQLLVCIGAAYTVSILKPAGSRIWFGLMCATLFVPPTVMFIPIYTTIVDLPFIHANLVNNRLAVWLPEAASAFNVFVLKRFFDRLPREVIDAARTDGANNWQLLTQIVLPMSRPVLAAVSIFAIVASWQDFLWPMITLPDPSKQPLSVAVNTLQHQVELRYVLAMLVIASIPPIALFLVFQRRIVGGLSDAGINR